jgi:hypothetical protein
MRKVENHQKAGAINGEMCKGCIFASFVVGWGEYWTRNK